ncbi:MAG: hypothetical protein C4523_04505 [Myxococcales bacterium]|nr:MAG: hypothetical protein C4523_04505 [Myxococcales bacterium]
MTESHANAQPTFWGRLIDLLQRGRLPMLVVSAALTAASLIVLPFVPFSSDPTEFMPRSEPSVKQWLDVTQRFGGLDTLLVGLAEPESPLTSNGLLTLAALTEKLSDLKAEGVLQARSLANVTTIIEDEDGVLNAELLVSSIPRTDDGLQTLAARIRADQQVFGSLVSRDLRGYIVLITPDPRKDPKAIGKAVREVVEREHGHLISHYFGAPFFEVYAAQTATAKLLWIGPLFFALYIVVGILWLRNWRAFLAVTLGGGVTLLWWMGGLYLFGVEASSAALNGALFLTMAALILLARLAERWVRRMPNSEPAGVFSPNVLLILAAFIVAFWLVGRSSVPFVSAFAQASAVGLVALGAFVLLAFVPLLSFFSRSSTAAEPPQPRPLTLSRFAVIVLAVAAIALCASAVRITFAVTPREMFGEKEEVRRTLAFFDERFGGADVFQIEAAGDFRDPAMAARLMRLTDLLEGSGAFGDVRSISQVLGFLGQRFGGVHRIPKDRSAMDNLWFFLEGSADVQPLVTGARREAMIAARVPPDSPLTHTERVERVQRAIADSEKLGVEGAVLRLKALCRRFDLGIPDAGIEGLPGVAESVKKKTDPATRHDKALAALKAFMDSPDAPFAPSDEEWARLAEALKGGAEMEPLITGMAGFAEMGGDAAMAKQLADTLRTRLAAIQLEAEAKTIVGELLGDKQNQVNSAFVERAVGVVVDWLDQPTSAATEMKLIVTGMPVVAEELRASSWSGLWQGLLVLLAAGALAFALFTRRIVPASRAAFEATVAAILTLGIGHLIGLDADGMSAPFYLAIPPISFILSAWTLERGGQTATPSRFAAGMALTFGVAFASLILSGIMPVIRFAGIPALGLAVATVVSHVSARVGRTGLQ